MRKKVVLLALIVLTLIASIFTASQTVKAESTTSIELTYGSYTTHVNERVELTATISGWGTPPYKYQWYTIFIPQDMLDRGFILPGLVKVAVPGATSSTFEFIESTPGTYNINLQIIDSLGNDRLIASRNFIIVQALPSPSQQSSPTNHDYAEYTISMNETLDFQVGTDRNASIQWYCDEVLVKSEYASFSNYTFVANSTGVHWIRYSVYGMGLCVPKKVTVLAQPLITQTETPALTNSPLPIGSSAQPNSIPIQLITTVILILVIACSSTLLYRRHRKTSNSKQ
jgi:hypothetical protein